MGSTVGTKWREQQEIYMDKYVWSIVLTSLKKYYAYVLYNILLKLQNYA